MHIALIIDDERLLHEGPMLNRLCVGLIDEGCTVTRIVPAEAQPTSEQRRHSGSGIALQIRAPFKVLPWLRRSRADEIVQAIPRSEPDIIYAIGRTSWPLAADLGRRLECPTAINIWAADLLSQFPRRRRAEAIGAFIAPTRPLADGLRELVDPSLVSHVPQGVAIPAAPIPVFDDPQRPISMAIVGSGRDVISYRALLGAMSRLLKQSASIQAVLELRGPQQHEIWKHANRLELLGSISAITDASSFRALITQCDVLVLPERYGEVRSLTLDAMAMGIPIICAEDPYLDFLIPEETAVLVAEAEPEAWATQLRKILSSPDFAQSLGRAGRQFVEQHHRSSIQVERLLETLERAVRGETIDFMPPAT